LRLKTTYQTDPEIETGKVGRKDNPTNEKCMFLLTLPASRDRERNSRMITSKMDTTYEIRQWEGMGERIGEMISELTCSAESPKLEQQAKPFCPSPPTPHTSISEPYH